MKSFCLIFCFAVILSGNVPAQTMVTQSNADSTVVITKDSRLDDLVKKQKEINQQKQTIPGFRIQIFFGSNRQRAQDVKVDFSVKHADVSSYLTYQQPNFKVRVGDFRTRLEAQKFQKRMEGEFATSFIVSDEIKLPALK